MRKFGWLLLVLMVPFLSACGGTGKGKQEKVLAMVNDQPITEAMLDEEAKSLPPYVRPILDTPKGREQFLESLITRDLLMQEALRRGMDRREDVRERLNMARRSILLEALPAESAAFVRERLDVLVYGIGAGPRVDGQLVISHDILGNFVGDIRPRFVSRFANLDAVVTDAFRVYASAVRSGEFPANEHLYPMDPAEAQALARADATHRERCAPDRRLQRVNP